MNLFKNIHNFAKQYYVKIEFESEYLRELYEDGKAKKKKYRFQPSVIKKYKNTVDTLRVVNRIEELFLFNSLNYEALSGDKKHLESVRVDSKYRIEFKTRIEGKEPHTIIICSIVELSNHYK